MDINDFRAVFAVLAFVAFIGIVFWAYSRKRKGDFDEAANLPFTGEGFPGENDAQAPPKREQR